MMVYVPAPYSRAAEVRAIHVRLHEMGIGVSSVWAERANGPEKLTSFDEAREAIRENDVGVQLAEFVLALVHPAEGGEMFAEIRYAQVLKKRVLWVGDRQTLSVFRPGVLVLQSVDAALEVLSQVVERERMLDSVVRKARGVRS